VRLVRQTLQAAARRCAGLPEVRGGNEEAPGRVIEGCFVCVCGGLRDDVPALGEVAQGRCPGARDAERLGFFDLPPGAGAGTAP